MAKVREIRRRIRSIEKTRQITKTMEMVATSKLKRATDRLHATQPYAEALAALVARDQALLARSLDGGGRLATQIEAQTAELRTQVRALPGLAGAAPDPLSPQSALVLGPAQRQAVALLLQAVVLIEDLDRLWSQLAAGSLPALQLTTLLEDHDATTAAAAAPGGRGAMPRRSPSSIGRPRSSRRPGRSGTRWRLGSTCPSSTSGSIETRLTTPRCARSTTPSAARVAG